MLDALHSLSPAALFADDESADGFARPFLGAVLLAARYASVFSISFPCITCWLWRCFAYRSWLGDLVWLAAEGKKIISHVTDTRSGPPSKAAVAQARAQWLWAQAVHEPAGCAGVAAHLRLCLAAAGAVIGDVVRRQMASLGTIVKVAHQLRVPMRAPMRRMILVALAVGLEAQQSSLAGSAQKENSAQEDKNLVLVLKYLVETMPPEVTSFVLEVQATCAAHVEDSRCIALIVKDVTEGSVELTALVSRRRAQLTCANVTDVDHINTAITCTPSRVTQLSVKATSTTIRASHGPETPSNEHENRRQQHSSTKRARDVSEPDQDVLPRVKVKHAQSPAKESDALVEASAMQAAGIPSASPHTPSPPPPPPPSPQSLPQPHTWTPQSKYAHGSIESVATKRDTPTSASDLAGRHHKPIEKVPPTTPSSLHAKRVPIPMAVNAVVANRDPAQHTQTQQQAALRPPVSKKFSSTAGF